MLQRFSASAMESRQVCVLARFTPKIGYDISVFPNGAPTVSQYTDLIRDLAFAQGFG
jgi:hypothetical protein